MSNESPRKRRKGTIAGLALIAFGVIGAFVGYYQDSHSFDYLRMGLAKDYAMVHLTLCTIAGLLIILWHNRPPPDDPDTYRNSEDRF